MCSACRPDTWLKRIDKMRFHPKYRYVWAHDTLTGIRETIVNTNHVTANQERAITNIEKSGRK